MRVLHINTNYLGTTLHQTMLGELERSEVENRVFVPTCSSYKPVIEPDENVTVCNCFRYWDGLSFFYKQWKIWRALRKSELLLNTDLIHAYTVSTDGNTAYKAHKKFGAKYMVAVRNTDLNYFFKKRFYLRWRGLQILLAAECVCFLSSSYREQLLCKYVPPKYQQVVRDKSYIIPNGIGQYWLDNRFLENDAKTKAQRLAEKKLRIVFAGRIDKFKNCRLTVGACKKLRELGWHVEYHVAGRVADQEEFALMEKSGFLVYHGIMSKEQLIELYRNSDIYVMPSHSETFGLTYVEAMSQGLPVIYSKGQGFDGQHPDGIVGYAVDSQSLTELTDAILECVYRYEEISAAAITASSAYNWSDICKKYVDIYKKLLE